MAWAWPSEEITGQVQEFLLPLQLRGVGEGGGVGGGGGGGGGVVGRGGVAGWPGQGDDFVGAQSINFFFFFF